jgi:hypothetical protein
MTKDRLVSQKTQNFAIVPSKPGTFTLPELNVTWFNTVTNKVQLATLPPQTITVELSDDALANIASQPVLPNKNILDNNTIDQSTSMASPQKNNRELTAAPQDKRLQWLFLSLWLLTIVAWFIHIRYTKRFTQLQPKTSHNTNTNQGNSFKRLADACERDDAAQALTLILPWVNQLMSQGVISHHDEQGQVASIANVPQLIDEQSFATALHDLQQHLYGRSAVSDASSWQGSTLLKAITKINNKPVSVLADKNWQLNP